MGDLMLNRSTLDIAILVIFGIAVAATAITANGAVGVVAVIAGGIVALYFAALRRNLPE